MYKEVRRLLRHNKQTAKDIFRTQNWSEPDLAFNLRCCDAGCEVGSTS